MLDKFSYSDSWIGNRSVRLRVSNGFRSIYISYLSVVNWTAATAGGSLPGRLSPNNYTNKKKHHTIGFE